LPYDDCNIFIAQATGNGSKKIWHLKTWKL
jgi:hypothetical protein